LQLLISSRFEIRVANSIRRRYFYQPCSEIGRLHVNIVFLVDNLDRSNDYSLGSPVSAKQFTIPDGKFRNVTIPLSLFNMSLDRLGSVVLSVFKPSNATFGIGIIQFAPCIPTCTEILVSDFSIPENKFVKLIIQW
jgi:hypothetical protein